VIPWHDSHYLIGRRLGTAITVAVVFVIYLVLEVIDRLTASPAMRRHVNAGSDTYFRERGSVWHAAWQATTDLFSQLRGGRFSDRDDR
jgi:hypothetical protein